MNDAIICTCRHTCKNGTKSLYIYEKIGVLEHCTMYTMHPLRENEAEKRPVTNILSVAEYPFPPEARRGREWAFPAAPPLLLGGWPALPLATPTRVLRLLP